MPDVSSKASGGGGEGREEASDCRTLASLFWPMDESGIQGLKRFYAVVRIRDSLEGKALESARGCGSESM